MTTKREERHRVASNTVNRLESQREALIESLCRNVQKLAKAKKKLARIEKAMAYPVKAVMSKNTTDKLVEKIDIATDVTDIPVSELPIPDFLDRRKRRDELDAAARAEIAAEAAARAKAKREKKLGPVRSTKLGPDAAKMPLTGKAALNAIRQRG